MTFRTAAVAVTAAIALTALGAGPAFADNHVAVVPQGQDGAFEHVAPRTLVVGDLATN
ncbi:MULTISPECIES: hypothetical protein [unclassified Streptomyces]|uniref:hypothetical protein n=1 Tax=unclassified Streptomyces TaxID=2593676 RepID=UPI0013A701DE|nr:MULTISPECIES: hypothetical protein [unclassified Streptomyces]